MKNPYSVRKLASGQHGVYRGNPTGILFCGDEKACRNWIASDIWRYRELNRDLLRRQTVEQGCIDRTLAAVPGSARVWAKLSATGRDWHGSIRAAERRMGAFERAGMRSTTEKYSEHCGCTADELHERCATASAAYVKLGIIRQRISEAARAGRVVMLRLATRDGEELLARYDVDGYGCLIELR